MYAVLNNYDNYLMEQAEWLQKVVASDTFKSAPYRLVVTNISSLANGWHSEQNIAKTWLPILNGVGIDLMLAGHLHAYIYFPEN